MTANKPDPKVSSYGLDVSSYGLDEMDLLLVAGHTIGPRPLLDWICIILGQNRPDGPMGHSAKRRGFKLGKRKAKRVEKRHSHRRAHPLL